MDISHRLKADFTEVGVASFTSYAKHQAVNGRLDSTLGFSGSCGVSVMDENHFSLNQKTIAQSDRAW